MAHTAKDAMFYFDMTIFQVEGYLFKVPRKPFEDQSDVFRSMFTLPPGKDTEVDGLSDDMPLHLDTVKKTDFRAFLQVLFPASYGEDVPLCEKEWLAVLGLANMWNFTKIRQISIEKLQHNSIDLITKIELAHRYDIREWLYGAYLALGKRAEPLTVDEGARLGYDFAIKMAQVRERLLRDKIAHPGAYRQRPAVAYVSGATRGSDTPKAGSGGGGGGGGSGRSGNGSGSGSSSQRGPYRAFSGTAGLWQGPFPHELEDEDDIVLARAISDIFGVRGDSLHFSLGDHDIEQDGIATPNPQSMPWVLPFGDL